MKHSFAFILFIAVIAFAAATLGTVFSQNFMPKKDVIHPTFYDSNGNLIASTSNAQSIVNGVPKVSFVAFEINVLNTGNTPLNISLRKNAGHISLRELIPNYQDAVLVQPGQYATWNTKLIDVVPYTGSTCAVFYTIVDGVGVDITMPNAPSLGATANICVQQDMTASFSISLNNKLT